jgi:hypothetical protein
MAFLNWATVIGVRLEIGVRPEIGARPELRICNRHTQRPEVYVTDTRLGRSRRRRPKARN